MANALAATGALDEAVTEFREATRLEPKSGFYQARLRQVERWRRLAPRLPDMAAGRGLPDSPVEGYEAAELAVQPFQRQYLLAVRLYQRAVAADPGRAAAHRYEAARAAALAAAGRDAGSPALGVEEWGYLTELVHAWLRAELKVWAGRAEEPRYRALTHQTLARWKQDPDLIAVRDQAWVAAMPPADRERWRALSADVDALLAKVGQSEATGK